MEHRLILGGEQFLPFARSCVTKLKALGLPYVGQSFEVDGVSIKVRIEPGHEYIRLEGDSAVVYEFFATGPELNPNKEAGGSLFDSLNNPGSAVRVVYTNKKLYAVPLWSSIHEDVPEDDDTPPRWPFVDRRWWASNDIWRGGKAPADNWLSVWSHPSEHFGSSHHYYDNKKRKLITSCRAYGPGASLMPIYQSVPEVTYSCTINQPNKVATFSFGVVPTNLTPVNPAEPYRWAGGLFGMYASTIQATVYSTSNIFAWVDTRVSKNPMFQMAPGPYYTETPNPNEFYYGSNAVVSNVADFADPEKFWFGTRINPESRRESQEPNTFDITPTRYYSTAVKSGAGKVNPNVHWRNAALHEATDENDNKVMLFVLTDTHNGFMFYEVKNYVSEFPPPTEGDLDGWSTEPSYRNIPTDQWVRVKPVMPEWVTLPGEDKKYEELSWSWRFDKKGTRAVCTPVHSEIAKVWLLLEPHRDWTLATVLIHPDDLLSYPDAVEAELYSIPQLSPESAAEVSARFETLWYAEVGEGLLATSMGNTPSVGGTVLFFKYLGNFYLLQNRASTIDPLGGFTAIVEEYGKPVKNITPGLVEVSISVELDHDDEGKLIIKPTVEVIRSDYYDDSKKLYADAAYYVATKRAEKTTDALHIRNLPQDDDLLVADIVVRSRKIKEAPEGGAFSQNVFDTYGYYRVQNATRSNEVTSLLLSAGVDVRPATVYPHFSFTPSGCVPAFFTATLVAHDLRYLAFVIATYHRRFIAKVDLTNSEPGGVAFAEMHNVLPRIQLRVPGEQLKDVNYSKEVCDGGTPLAFDPASAEFTPTKDMTENYRDYEGQVNGFDVYTDYVSGGEWPGTIDMFEAGQFGPLHYGPDPMTKVPLDFQPGGGYTDSGITQNVTVLDTYVYEGSTYEQKLIESNYYFGIVQFPPLAEGYAGASDAETLIRMQKFLPFVTSGQYYMVFSFSPTGDYAVYLDVRSSQFPPRETSTETSGVIDVIKIDKLYTSHKEAFNTAFDKTLDYDYIPIDEFDRPGRFGTNGIFMYGLPTGTVSEEPEVPKHTT